MTWNLPEGVNPNNPHLRGNQPKGCPCVHYEAPCTGCDNTCEFNTVHYCVENERYPCTECNMCMNE